MYPLVYETSSMQRCELYTLKIAIIPTRCACHGFHYLLCKDKLLFGQAKNFVVKYWFIPSIGVQNQVTLSEAAKKGRKPNI
jgi:hypothetical protein